MGLSRLQQLARTRAGRVLLGGTAVGLGTAGTALAQDGQPSTEAGAQTAGTTVTPIEVEGEQILVPVSPVDDVLADPLDEEPAGVEVAADTPVSPDSPASPAEEESPTTVEAADDTPVTPDTPPSPDSPVSPEAEATPVSPETQASPASPASPQSP